MKNITIIQDISLLFKYDPNKDLTKVKYLNSPIPFYSEKKDEIVVWASSEFGKKKWDLNLFEVIKKKGIFSIYSLNLWTSLIIQKKP